jgi:hypothetical protein
MAMLGSAGAVAIAYFLAARLGLALLAPESDVAVFEALPLDRGASERS